VCYRWFSRPQKTITKTQYIEKAKAIGERAKELAGAALDIKKKEEAEGRSRKLNTQTKALHKELLLLEDEERELDKLYPQVCHDSANFDALCLISRPTKQLFHLVHSSHVAICIGTGPCRVMSPIHTRTDILQSAEAKN
jgi:hypothetical protein